MLLIGAFVILCGINVSLTIIVFAILPVGIFFAVMMRRRMASAFTKTRVEIAEVNANLENAISGIRVTRAYNNDAHESEKFEAYNRRFKKARGIAYKVMGEFSSAMTLFTDLIYLIVLGRRRAVLLCR